jgi:hypothetical protein
MTALEQSRKSSDREQTALHQAQESLEQKEAATTNATRSAQRKNYMLDLMTSKSSDMVVRYFCLNSFALFFCVYHCAILFFSFISHMCVSGYCC